MREAGLTPLQHALAFGRAIWAKKPQKKFSGPFWSLRSQQKMNPEAQTLSSSTVDEDEIKYLLLSDDEDERLQAADALFRAHREQIMRCIEYHHPGLNLPDRQDVLLSSIERFVHTFRNDPRRVERSLKPQLLRTVILVGKEKYRKIARRQERETGDLIESVAETLKDSELGETWHQVMDASFRDRVRLEIQKVAACLKPRQRQIAIMFAETWGLELTEKESIDEIFRTSGDRLTRDQFKRALDEVRKKLREPILRLLKEEGICPRNLILES